MTKKHFIALADAIRVLPCGEVSPTIVNALANFCASQNPNFNRQRWLAYVAGECGPNGGSLKKG